jgi:hypothetical protein
MIRSRVSSRVKRLRAKWVEVIEVMNDIIHHLFALSNAGHELLELRPESQKKERKKG